MFAAAVPSPNTLPVEEVIGLLKPGLAPNDAVPPKAAEPPKDGGLPKTGALPKPPGFVGVEKEPKPCDATLPAPVLKVPLGFCSPKVEDWPKPKVFAPLFPKRLLVPGWVDCPNPTVEAVVPNGFLLAASSLAFPPRPLKNPPEDGPTVLVELEPNKLLPDDGCPNTLPLVDCWPKPGVAVGQPNPEG